MLGEAVTEVGRPRVEGDVSKTRRRWEGTTMRMPVAREGIASTEAGGRSVTGGAGKRSSGVTPERFDCVCLFHKD